MAALSDEDSAAVDRHLALTVQFCQILPTTTTIASKLTARTSGHTTATKTFTALGQFVTGMHTLTCNASVYIPLSTVFRNCALVLRSSSLCLR
jgi:hypothetical protein